MKIIYVFPIISTSIWGVAISGAKILSNQGFSPIDITFLRFAISSLAFLPSLLWTHRVKGQNLPSKSDWFPLIGLAITGVSLNNIVFYIGLGLTDASIASLIVSFNPLATMLFGVLMLNEKMTRVKWISVLLGFFGVYIIIGSNLSIGKLTGNLLILCAVTIWGSSFSFSKRASQKGFSPFLITAWSQVIGVLILLPLGYRSTSKLLNSSQEAIFWLFFLGLISSVFGYIIHYKAVEVMGPGKVAPSTNIIPLSGVVASFFILNESISSTLIIGALLIISGVLLVQKERL